MDGFYLVNIKINGVKSLENDIVLSFYKKCISRHVDIKKYNIKGVYGKNGSGKTAIISAVKILKEIITNPLYLNNEVNQKKLFGLINKKSKKLNIEADYLVDIEDNKHLLLFKYAFELSCSDINTFYISHEKLECKNATSRSDYFDLVYEVMEGNLVFPENSSDPFLNMLFNETKNLLNSASLSSLFLSKKDIKDYEFDGSNLYMAIVFLSLFGFSLFVYLEDNDLHDDYILNEMYLNNNTVSSFKILRNFSFKNDFSIKYGRNIVPKDQYDNFVEVVKQLKGFIQIFKSELIDINIDETLDKEYYVCKLIMRYDNYSVDSEFESTGIKKLIVLFRYIQKMYEGNIVFIDEMDANLHDVYLCALLEYLSEFGKGQLCFTSHNIGPMSILKSKKKSIDFLSDNKTIYSWKKSGNYSPALLYRKGMISGSPFNIDITAFIGVFDEE